MFAPTDFPFGDVPAPTVEGALHTTLQGEASNEEIDSLVAKTGDLMLSVWENIEENTGLVKKV